MEMTGREFSTQEKLLAAAQKLVLKKGFVATTVDEICEEAGLTKGSFFHYFQSKEDLGEAVIDFFCEGQKRMIEMAPFKRKKDPLERVLGLIDFFIEVMNNPHIPKSCVVGNMTQELAETNTRIRSACAKNFSWWSEFLKRELDAAVEKHLPPSKRSSIDTQGLADYFLTVLQGSLILIKATQDIAIGERNLKHFRKYVKQVFKIYSSNVSKRR